MCDAFKTGDLVIVDLSLCKEMQLKYFRKSNIIDGELFIFEEVAENCNLFPPNMFYSLISLRTNERKYIHKCVIKAVEQS